VVVVGWNRKPFLNDIVSDSERGAFAWDVYVREPSRARNSTILNHPGGVIAVTQAGAMAYVELDVENLGTLAVSTTASLTFNGRFNHTEFGSADVGGSIAVGVEGSAEWLHWRRKCRSWR
jgi:hypothetical protein